MQKFLATLLRFKLIYHDKTTYDGARFLWGFVWAETTNRDAGRK